MRVLYKKRFEKEFKKLDEKVKLAFLKRLELFAENRYDRLLRNHLVDVVFPGCRSINISGDLRAIFREEGDVVIFLHIGTHSQLYR
jgi:addiction module RelE/StbE family toxin